MVAKKKRKEYGHNLLLKLESFFDLHQQLHRIPFGAEIIGFLKNSGEKFSVPVATLVW